MIKQDQIVDDYRDAYINWLKNNIDQYRVGNNIFRLTMPFLDRNNDHIEIYIIKNDDGTYYITDDGATINELEFSGYDTNSSQKRKNILKSIVGAHGVFIGDHNELAVRCTESDLPMKKHMLSQCMVKVSDMFYLTKSNIQSIFLEDVQKYLDENNVRYLDNICITGKSKLVTHFDFGIAKSNSAPERLIKVINNMDISAAKNIIFSWNDTKEMRTHETTLYAFIQNTDKKISQDSIEALRAYGICPAMWSDRKNYIKELTA